MGVCGGYGGCGGLRGFKPLFSSGSLNPSFLVGVASFFEMVLVLSEADESEYVISKRSKQCSCLEFQSK